MYLTPQHLRRCQGTQCLVNTNPFKRGREGGPDKEEPEAKRIKLDDNVLKVKRLSSSAIIPTKGSKYAAGYDLYSTIDVMIPPFITREMFNEKIRLNNNSTLIPTDIAFGLPHGTYGRISPRSSLSAQMIEVGGGVIDEDYTGNVKVLLTNFSRKEFFVRKGDRIAQLIIEKIEHPEIKEVDELDPTERGEGGFGSTGQ